MYVPIGTNIHIDVRMYVLRKVYNVDVIIVMVILQESQYNNMSLDYVNCGMYGVRYVRYWYVDVTLLRP